MIKTTTSPNVRRAAPGKPAVEEQTPGHCRLLPVLGLGLSVLACAVGCQGRPTPTKADPASLQREAEQLRKQNEEMLKR